MNLVGTQYSAYNTEGYRMSFYPNLFDHGIPSLFIQVYAIQKNKVYIKWLYFWIEISIFDNRNLGYFNYGKKSEKYPLLGTAMFYTFYI